MRTFTALLVFLLLISIPIRAVEPNPTGLRRPQLQSNMDMNFYSLSNGNAITVTGLVTAASYRGDGSQLTGVGGASQTPITQDINGAGHSQTNLANVAANLFFGSAAGMTNVPSLGQSTNLYKMFQFTALMQSLVPTTNRPAKIMAFGDSTCAEYFRSAGRALADTIAANYGYYSTSVEDDGNGLSWIPTYTNAYATASDTNYFSAYFVITNTGTITWTNFEASDGRYRASAIEIRFIQQPGGGTFKLQTDRSGSFVDEAIIFDLGFSYNLLSTNVVLLVGNTASLHFRLVGVSGTHYITDIITTRSISQNDKLQLTFGGQGGFGLDHFMTCNSNTIWTAFHLIAPDLLVFKMDHEASIVGSEITNLQNFITIVTNASPSTLVMFIDNPPMAADPATNAFTIIPIEKQMAASINGIFVDIAAFALDTNYVQNSGTLNYLNDGLHPTIQYYQQLLAPFYQYWNFHPSALSVGLVPQDGVQFAKIGVGSPPSSNPDISIVGATSRGGGNWDIRSSPGSLSSQLEFNGGPSLFGDGSSTWIEWGPSGNFLWVQGGTQRGASDSSGGFWFGPTNGTSGSGDVTIENWLTVQGPQTNSSITAPSGGFLSIDNLGGQAAGTFGSGLSYNTSTHVLTATGGGGSATNAINNLNGTGTNTAIFYSFSVTNNFDGSYFFLDTTNNAWGFIQTNGNKWVYTNGVQSGVGTNTLWASNIVATGWIAASNAVYASSFQGTVGVSNLAGTISAANMPAFSGVVTTSAGSTVTSFGSFSSATLKAAMTDYNGNWWTNILGTALTGASPTNAIGVIQTNGVQLATGQGTLNINAGANVTVTGSSAGSVATVTIAAAGAASSNGGALTNLNYGTLTGGVMVATFDGSYLWPGDTLPATWTTNTPSLSSIAIQSAGPSIKAWSISQSATNQWLLQWRIPEEWDGQPVTPVITVISGTNSVPANALTNTWGCSAALVGTALGTAQLLTNKLPAVTGGLSKTNWDFPPVTIAGSPLPGDYVQFQFQSRAGVTPWSTTNLELLAAVAIRYTATNAQNNAIQRP